MKHSAEASSLAGEAYATVRRRIVRGELVMGQAVSRRKIAAELGMSFLPVSEALLRLEFEGLLESRPRAGTRVRIPSPEDVRGHYMVREALEAQAAMLFAEVASAADRAELQKLAARVDALSVQANRLPYMNLHQKLHRRIADFARCRALSLAIDQTHVLASTWFCMLRRPQGPAGGPAPRLHRDLIKVLTQGTPAQATAAMRAHIAWSRREAMERLKPYFRLRKANGRRFFRKDHQGPVVEEQTQ